MSLCLKNYNLKDYNLILYYVQNSNETNNDYDMEQR